MDKSGSESQALHTLSKYSLKKLVSKKKSTEEPRAWGKQRGEAEASQNGH